MAIIGKLENGRLLVSQRVAGPASYANAAPPAIVFSDLSQVEEIVSMQIDDGRSIQELATTLASVTFRVRGQGLAQVASGTVLPTTGTNTIVTGIGRVLTAAVASLRGALSLTHHGVTCDIGNQAGAPAAGSIILTHTKPTGAADVTPIAATTPWVNVDWIAYAADNGEVMEEIPDTTNLSGSIITALAYGR